MNNRTIKFKARRKDTREWVEGFYHRIQNDDGSYGHFIREDTTRHIANVTQTNFEVNPETVCQFVGLLDKHGKEIWEGDKLHRHLGIEWVVTFHDSKWVALSANGSGLYLNASEFIEAEVTGSVHDEKPHGNGE